MKRLYEAILNAIPLRIVRYACMAVLIAAAIAILNDILRGGVSEYGGQEVVEVHITADGLMRAVSRVSITRCPNNGTYIPLRLPNPNATLESVCVDGRGISFKSGKDIPESEAGMYFAMPSLPEKAMRKAFVEVTWSIPLEQTKDMEGVVTFPLRGLIPVRNYAANVVLDDGAPYAFEGKFNGLRDYNMFATRRDRYVSGGFGCCLFRLLAIPAGE